MGDTSSRGKTRISNSLFQVINMKETASKPDNRYQILEDSACYWPYNPPDIIRAEIEFLFQHHSESQSFL